MAAADKNVVGLLNGIARREYFGESDITDEFLHQELFPDLSAEQFDAILKRYETLTRNIVSADMDYNQLEAFLTSQMKRKQGSLTQEQAAAFLKFWKSQKVKIHDVLVQRSSWNNKLKDISWRIDLKSQGRHLEQINSPVAIVEMQIEKRGTESKETDVFQFEMDETQLSNVLTSISEIETKLTNYAQ
ncbi:PREDICTED: COMM domain-containing protein 1-like [Acropora digitifera]|uniref:COMM domain-containing protein 1-like n=1 Tax=Acropora digitifera TaxID=70779 RepID=UPI00077A23F0|nr:PREDICTED: COMM domain-containing protein 1-like [Acropora digitifera]XP_029201909.1 COMM domain-containing protein 1-like [Acropora millepora]